MPEGFVEHFVDYRFFGARVFRAQGFSCFGGALALRRLFPSLAVWGCCFKLISCPSPVSQRRVSAQSLECQLVSRASHGFCGLYSGFRGMLCGLAKSKELPSSVYKDFSGFGAHRDFFAPRGVPEIPLEVCSLGCSPLY